MGLRLRRALRFTPPVGPVRPTDLDTLWPPGPLAAELRERYPLVAWRNSVRPWEVPEAVYVLGLLDAAVPSAHRVRSASTTPRLDVGCKSWSYLAAERSVAPGPWVGVELDAFRRIGGLQTRASIARWRLRAHPACRIVTDSARTLDGRFDLVTWFLPFVAPEPHLAWGLTPDRFEPDALLAHVWALVAPGGLLIVSNQGVDEAALQRDLFARASIEADELGPVAAALSPFQHERPVFRAQKPDNDPVS